MKSLINFTLILSLFLVSCSGKEDAEEASNESSSDENNTVNEEVENVEPPVNTYIIQEESVGVFNIGEKVPDPLPKELKSRQFLETDLGDDGKAIEHTHNVVFNMLEDVLELIMEKDKDKHHVDKLIEEMIVLSNYYQTKEGIGVGSTIEEFKETYSDMSVWYDRVHNRYYLETGNLLGAQFLFNELDIKRQAKGSADHQQVNASYIKEGAKIEKIRIH